MKGPLGVDAVKALAGVGVAGFIALAAGSIAPAWATSGIRSDTYYATGFATDPSSAEAAALSFAENQASQAGYPAWTCSMVWHTVRQVSADGWTVDVMIRCQQ
ncbi:MAG: hypothetical protein ACRDSH_17630 [Pseudonocardiaceae bacterium]